MRIKEKGAVLSSGSLVDYGFDHNSFENYVLKSLSFATLA